MKAIEEFLKFFAKNKVLSVGTILVLIGVISALMFWPCLMQLGCSLGIFFVTLPLLFLGIVTIIIGLLLKLGTKWRMHIIFGLLALLSAALYFYLKEIIGVSSLNP